METKKKKIKLNKKILIPSIIILTLLTITTIYGLVININARKMDKYTEITFVTPNQAIIFWKSEKPDLGYIKYGENKYQRKTIETQTSSDKSEIHVAFIERIPSEGVFITTHLENDNPLIFPKIQHIQYTDTNNE